MSACYCLPATFVVPKADVRRRPLRVNSETDTVTDSSDWPSIDSHFASASDQTRVNGVRELARELGASAYGSRLFVWTSMFDLCIAQVGSPNDGGSRYTRPYLRVRQLDDGRLEFRYHDTAIETRQWSRLELPADGFSRLESFFRQLNWFGSGG